MLRPARLVLFGVLAGLTLGPALAQGVRSAGMAGLILPGPQAADLNPAYAAYSDTPYGYASNLPLPLGLVNLALRPSTSPVYYFTDPQTFKDSFDLLAFFDQLSHPLELLINPPTSPTEVVFHVSADGIRITDGEGNPFDLSGSREAGSATQDRPLRAPAFEYSVPTGVPGLRLAVGAFFDATRFDLALNDALRTDLLSGRLRANTTYALEWSGAASGGLTVDLGYATKLPRLPGLSGDLYVGTQVQGFYGLYYGDVLLNASTTTDDDALPGSVDYAASAFYVYPGQGYGAGARFDLGLALDGEGWTVGLGLRNLYAFETWQGQRWSLAADGGTAEVTDETLTTSGFAPQVFVNGAYLQDVGLGEVLLGADLAYLNGAVQGHAGLEYRFQIFRLRGGFGYENGPRLGLGAGIDLGFLSSDLALTSHPAPLTGDTVFGLAASLGVHF